MATYNHPVSQRALNQQSPTQALKRWQIDKPELVVKRVYEQAGLDTSGPQTRRSNAHRPFDSANGDMEPAVKGGKSPDSPQSHRCRN